MNLAPIIFKVSFGQFRQQSYFLEVSDATNIQLLSVFGLFETIFDNILEFQMRKVANIIRISINITRFFYKKQKNGKTFFFRIS